VVKTVDNTNTSKQKTIIICCRVSKTIMDALVQEANNASVNLVIEELSNQSLLIRSMKHKTMDCVLYELVGTKKAPKLPVKLCDASERHQIPLLLFAKPEQVPHLRQELRTTQYSHVHVAKRTPKTLFSALTELIHAHALHSNPPSAGERLVDMVAAHARSLHRCEEMYHFLLNACSDAVLVLKVDASGEKGSLETLNEAASRCFGYTRYQKRHISLRQLFSFSNTKKVSGSIKNLFKLRKFHFETMMTCRDGIKMPVEVVARAFDLDDEFYRVILLVHLLKDEAPKKENDQSNIGFNSIASYTGLIVYDGFLKTRQMIVEGATQEICGDSPQLVTRQGLKGWRERILPADYQRVIGTINNAIKHLNKYEVQYGIVHKSGAIHYIEDRGIVLPDESGKGDRILGTMKDVTLRVASEKQRQHLENKVRHTQRLESLGVLAGGIAHDFNNMLAGIIGLTDLALQEVEQGSFIHEDLTEVLAAANRAKELVRQILAFSRQSDQERSPIYLHIIARNVLKLLRSTIPDTITVTESIDTNSGIVLANSSQLYQVITNIIINAVQAIGTAVGTIKIKIQDRNLTEKDSLSFPGTTPGSYVQLSIADTGHGMSESVRTRIFDPFFTTRDPGVGTGMGLAMAHGIITNHGGVITVKSKLKSGSRFDVFLPRISGVQTESTSLVEPLKNCSAHILFVDDDCTVLRFAESALPRYGFTVTTCQGASQAMRLFLQDIDKFDLVILDQIMPGMTGIQLAQEIHQHAHHLPIILFTGFCDQVEHDTLDSVGIRDLVLKPIIIKDLVDAIHKVLNNSRGVVDKPSNP
jgi:signal transduction histidine kinase/CheY-like chemotaxis protein